MRSPAIHSSQVSPQAHLIAAAIVTAASFPVAVVSMLPQTQFAEALPTSLTVLLALIGFSRLVFRNPLLRARGSLAVVVFAIFALRLCVALGIGRWWWWPQTIVRAENDWDLYESLGWDLAQSGLSGEALFSYPLNELGLTYLVGALYTLAGRNPLVLTVLFTFLGGWAGLILAELVALVCGMKPAGRAAVLASLIPASLFLGSIPAKDVVATFLFLKSLVVVARMVTQHAWTIPRVVETSLLSVLISIVRAAFIPLLAISLVGILAVVIPKARKSLLVLLVLLALAGYWIVAWREGEMWRGVTLAPMVVSELASARTGQVTSTLADAGFTFATDEASSIALATYWDGELSRVHLVPLRAVLMFFVPFPPTNFATLDSAIGSLNTVMMILLAPAVCAAVASRYARGGTSLRELTWLWLPMLTHVMALSAGLPFVQMRYALLSQFLFVGLAAIALRPSKRLAELYLLLPIVMALLVLAYIAIKNL
jgi:hypothetical protein